MSAGQREKALSLLESMNLSALPRGSELHIIEAELLAETGHCDTALGHFTTALSSTLTADVEERARYGRANCQTDVDARRRDFEAYLQRFPYGRSAAQAQSALEP